MLTFEQCNRSCCSHSAHTANCTQPWTVSVPTHRPQQHTYIMCQCNHTEHPSQYVPQQTICMKFVQVKLIVSVPQQLQVPSQTEQHTGAQLQARHTCPINQSNHPWPQGQTSSLYVTHNISTSWCNTGGPTHTHQQPHASLSQQHTHSGSRPTQPHSALCSFIEEMRPQLLRWSEVHTAAGAFTLTLTLQLLRQTPGPP